LTREIVELVKVKKNTSTLEAFYKDSNKWGDVVH